MRLLSLQTVVVLSNADSIYTPLQGTPREGPAREVVGFCTLVCQLEYWFAERHAESRLQKWLRPLNRGPKLLQVLWLFCSSSKYLQKSF